MIDQRSKTRFVVTVLLAIVMALSGLALAVRGVVGTIDRPVSLHSPMNAAGFFALSIMLLLALRSRATTDMRTLRARPSLWIAMGLVTLIYLPYVSFPLLADDYSHLWQARHASGPSLLKQFTTAPPDRFFRPLTYVAYAAEAPLSGATPWRWRTSNLVLHLVNVFLVGLLARRLGWSHAAAFVAAMLFGLHASRPEVVTWVAARFDLLATLFGLLALLAILRAAECESKLWIAAAGIALTLALLSKEAAFAVPLLAALLLWYRGVDRRTLLRGVGVLCAVALLVLLWRTAVIGGVGGYRNAADGRPTVFSMRPTTTGKALTMRLWGSLVTPVNWTHQPEWWLALALIASLAGWAFLARRGVPHRTLLLGVGWVMLAALPVHQFLSIGPDLEKSRVLYLPSVGFALLVGALVTDRRTLIASLLVLTFEGTALVHNLREWQRVGQLAYRTCQEAAAFVSAQPGPVQFGELPNVIDGVYFLKTGFRECVASQIPPRLNDIQVVPDEAAQYRWNPQLRRLQGTTRP